MGQIRTGLRAGLLAGVTVALLATTSGPASASETLSICQQGSACRTVPLSAQAPDLASAAEWAALGACAGEPNSGSLAPLGEVTTCGTWSGAGNDRTTVLAHYGGPDMRGAGVVDLQTWQRPCGGGRMASSVSATIRMGGRETTIGISGRPC